MMDPIEVLDLGNSKRVAVALFKATLALLIADTDIIGTELAADNHFCNDDPPVYTVAIRQTILNVILPGLSLRY